MISGFFQPVAALVAVLGVAPAGGCFPLARCQCERRFAGARQGLCGVLLALGLAGGAPGICRADTAIFARSNLMAWCIVPFDTQRRGPEARAQMLARLGIPRLAYDWRAEHIPTFDAEVAAMQRHGIELAAWWFPDELNAAARAILECIERNRLHPQLWVMLEGGPHLRWEQAFEATAAAQAAHVERLVARVKPLAVAAAQRGCQIALYNHGGWSGVPENQLQIIRQLRQDGVTNVGMVYTQHHGHGEISRFAGVFEQMKPYLLAITLNGMMQDGDRLGHDLGTMPLGQGDEDLRLLRVIKDSGWSGPVGLILEVNADAEVRLQDNLDGLDWLRAQLDGRPAGPRPRPRSWRRPETAPPVASPPAAAASARGLVLAGKPEYRERPLTIECRARLNSAQDFNILVASDPKTSAEHWELYAYAGSGGFSLYQPGRGGEFQSAVNICDGQWHHLAAVLEARRVRLYVDGALVKDAPAPPRQGQPLPGGLAIGQLVEGTIGCDGEVEQVRISRGVREITPQSAAVPLESDAQTLGWWQLAAAGQPQRDSQYWTVEDAAARARLPLYQIIPAASPEALTPTDGLPARETFRTWHRSHGDNGGRRFSALDQINRLNVTNLQVAWVYHSGDGSNFIQCNPIIVGDVMYAPTSGKHLAAVNAATGVEVWRFKPEGKPAWRGLIYRPAEEAGASARLLFCAGKFLYALDPKTGRPIPDFGDGGKVLLPGAAPGDFGAATAGPALFERILVVPGFEKDVWGFDAITGRHLWTFHTVPHPGELGYDTWDRPVAYGANCWGGMAMDEGRGIAYVTTGGPKPNFIGVGHRGDNLFANCLIALDARTGRRLWHLQEVRHDLWDLDIPAPPNLATITRNGKRVDVVAAVTKVGHTLLCDRVTGEPIFPFRLRRAPTSDLPGERTAPYQPDLELPEPFARQEFTRADLTERTEAAAEFALTQFKSATTGWFRPASEGRVNLFFNIDGGAEWTGACVDPDTGRLYVTANHLGWFITVARDDDPPDDPHAPKTSGRQIYDTLCAQCHGADRMGLGTAPALRGLRHRLTDEQIMLQIRRGSNAMPAHPESVLNNADLQRLVDFLMVRDRPAPAPAVVTERPRYRDAGYPKFYDPEGYPANKPPWGSLSCLDLNTGKLLWQVPHGEYPELAAQGVPKTGTENYGGAIVTAGGLVFCAGTRDNKLWAYDKDTGAALWSGQLPFTGNAPPATYAVNGRQYVVIAACGGNKLGTPYGDAYVAFALPPGRHDQ
ncbi:MAG TPA: PQQ-binding-like beta-propeller repeat protein [Verrucomicrobiota bacterium]|nr:PQQ-binding-like beta-propeller repeat protein [Verrucomicrobiota bacterium]HNT16196.1 PQQ-binding-like beta-propeller repeat protein [Verrucomicrobiota bacterium]